MWVITLYYRLISKKLLARISKEFGKKGAPVKPDDMFIPWDEKTGKSKGCAI